MIRKLWQYQEQVMGISNTQAQETITPDKWQPNTNIPQANWKKAALYSVAALAPFFVTSPQALTQPEVPKVFNQQPVVITTQLSFQYQAKVDPLVPITPPETLTLDKWYVKTSEPRFDVKRNQHLYPTFTVVDPSQLTQPERVSLDKWEQPQSLPKWDAKRQQQTYPSSFLNPLPIGTPATSVDAAVNQTSTPYFRRPQNQFLYPAFSTDPNSLTLSEVPKIFSQESLVLSKIRSTQYQGLAFTQVVATPELVTIDKWFQPTSVPVRRPIRLTSGENTLVQIVNTVESITLDKWQQPTSQPRFDVRRNQHLYPSFSIDTNQLTLTETPKVFEQQSLVLSYPRSTQYQAFTFVNEGNLRELITLDKWFRETQLPRFDIKRQQYLHPTLFASLLPIPNAEVVTLDKWEQPQSLPTLLRKTAHLAPTFFADHYGLTLKEVVKVFSNESVVIYRVRTTQYQALAFTHHRLPTVYDDKYAPRSTNYNDKYSARNSSYDDKYTSRNSNYSDKYSSRGSGYSDKYSERNTPYNDKYPKS